jgi:hypothetical protein
MGERAGVSCRPLPPLLQSPGWPLDEAARAHWRSWEEGCFSSDKQLEGEIFYLDI